MGPEGPSQNVNISWAGHGWDLSTIYSHTCFVYSRPDNIQQIPVPAYFPFQTPEKDKSNYFRNKHNSCFLCSRQIMMQCNVLSFSIQILKNVAFVVIQKWHASALMSDGAQVPLTVICVTFHWVIWPTPTILYQTVSHVRCFGSIHTFSIHKGFFQQALRQDLAF